MTSKYLSDLLLAAHMRAGKKFGVTFYNIGWVESYPSYVSKVSDHRILHTEKIKKGKYKHTLEFNDAYQNLS